MNTYVLYQNSMLFISVIPCTMHFDTIDISLIGNLMNLLVHFVIYWHESCFESSQNCTSRKRVQIENFQNITSDHKSRNATAGSYDILINSLYSQQNYSIALLCTFYVLQKSLQWVPNAHMFYLNQSKNVML